MADEESAILFCFAVEIRADSVVKWRYCEMEDLWTERKESGNDDENGGVDGGANQGGAGRGEGAGGFGPVSYTHLVRRMITAGSPKP